ncbi:MAG: aminotransferase class III-fold pyridoxal phosphate-dependent enzyme [Acidobacteria bacterium]|nr:aminotransferase class III-fold pyridoxal phosphate-dependent enzyme [Acidobacteriota bacterium]
MSTTTAPPQRPEIKTELPGPRAREIVAADAEFVTPSYPRPDYQLVAERGEGVWVTDVDGNVFLDCNAGVAVCSTGHCHPEIVRAIQDQAAKLIHMCGTDFYYEHMPALARKLDEIVPIDGPTRTHFANSGTEAVETALKLAMYKTGRQKFIAFFNSFHGRTLGSLSLTSSRVAQRRGFHRSALDVTHVPYPNAFRHPFTGERSDGATVSAAVLDWIENRLFKTTTPADEVAAIVVEAVQGEGGYVPAPREFLHGLRRICDDNGILLVVDEVQSGMGRTGKMFACEHHGVKAQNAAEVGAHLRRGLEKLMRKHDCVGDVRGFGLMLGVEFVTDRASMTPAPELRDRVEYACYERGLIILGAGANTIRWSPPLILAREHADVALEIFDEAITAAKSN